MGNQSGQLRISQPNPLVCFRFPPLELTTQCPPELEKNRQAEHVPASNSPGSLKNPNLAGPEGKTKKKRKRKS